MDTLKQIGIALASALLVVLIAFSISPRTSQVVYKDNPSKPLGALSGPEIPFDYIRVGDLALFPKRVPLSTATTTVCTIDAPAATSTLIMGGIRFEVSSTSATTVTMAKAARGSNATTTLIGSQNTLAANAQVTLVASSTGSVAGNGTVFGPYERFVVSLTGGQGTFSPTGVCSAIFIPFDSF